jgi:serine phosphatase RsbU (regulator of sigma subunit)
VTTSHPAGLLSAILGDRRDRLGLGVGLGAVLAAAALDLALPGRAFPLTTVLLGPWVASVLACPRRVAVVGAVSLGAAVGRAAAEQLTGSEAWTRVLLVLVAAGLAVLAAAVRCRRERALQRAARFEERSRSLQRRLLPALQATEQVAISARYRPSTDDVLGGDVIDVVPFRGAGPGAVAFCVGDVSGHDATAAGTGAALRAAWRTLALSGGDPTQWLTALDRLVRADTADDDDVFATACVGVLDPANRRLLLASAGHPCPVLLAERAVPVEVDAGPPLGLPEGLGGGWTSQTVRVEPLSALLLYTDGLVEGRRAPGSPHRYGEEPLRAWLDADPPARQLDGARLDRLVEDVESVNGGPLHDDVAVVVLAHTGAPVPATAPPPAVLVLH